MNEQPPTILRDGVYLTRIGENHVSVRAIARSEKEQRYWICETLDGTQTHYLPEEALYPVDTLRPMDNEDSKTGEPETNPNDKA